MFFNAILPLYMMDNSSSAGGSSGLELNNGVDGFVANDIPSSEVVNEEVHQEKKPVSPIKRWLPCPRSIQRFDGKIIKFSENMKMNGDNFMALKAALFQLTQVSAKNCWSFSYTQFFPVLTKSHLVGGNYTILDMNHHLDLLSVALKDIFGADVKFDATDGGRNVRSAIGHHIHQVRCIH